METQNKTYLPDKLYINQNIKDCWQLVKLAHQKKKEERENRRSLKNKL
jgi:hypothetical protein